ncbi:MAG: hypothetical protein GC156_10490 [Actinomycetales bacterium]|nr:hypothetical protein [Actinomycetales bacterium]
MSPRPFGGWSRGETAAFLVLAGLVAAGLLLTVLRQFGYGLEYDESYLLGVVRNLVAGRGYVDDGITFGTSGAPFEPRISTGPTVVLPAAGVWWLTDGAIEAVRIVPLLYFAVLLVSIAWLFLRAGGPWTSLGALAGLLAIPVVTPDLQNTSLMPGRLVGELPATALLVASAALLAARRPFMAGLLGGLAVLTKFVFLLPVAVLLLTVIAWSLVRDRSSAWRTLLRYGAAVLIPLLAFELAKVLTLGVDGYRQHLSQTRSFMAAQGIEEASATRVLREKAHELDLQVGIALLVGALLVAVAAVAVVGWSLRRPARSAESDRLPRLVDLPWASIGGLGLGALAGLAWWLLRSAQTSGRPALPSVLLLSVICFGLLGYLLARLREIAPGQFLTRALPAVAIVAVARDSSGQQLLSAQEAAVQVLRADVGYVPADSYWTHPDLALLSGLPIRQPGPADPPFTVRTSLQSRVEGGWSDAHAAASDCGLVLYDSRDVIICTAPPR